MEILLAFSEIVIVVGEIPPGQLQRHYIMAAGGSQPWQFIIHMNTCLIIV